MAIDSHDKRRSASSMLIFRRRAAVPNADIDNGDRKQAVGRYRGIETAFVVQVLAPFFAEAVEVFVAGAFEAEVSVAGVIESEVFVAGAFEAEVKE